MITSTDVRDHVLLALDGNEGFDVDGIVRELIETYDLTSDRPADTFDGIESDDFWGIVAKHDRGV